MNLLDHRYQMMHLADKPPDGGGVLVFNHAVHLGKPQGVQRPLLIFW